MYLPECLSGQPLLNNLRFFLTKFSKLDSIFKVMHEITQRANHKAFVPVFLFILFISSSRLFLTRDLCSASMARLTPVNLFSVSRCNVRSMFNSSSSIIPFFNVPDTTLSNTANAGIIMSINFVTFLSFVLVLFS